MDFNEDYILSSNRVTLRPLELRDLDQLYTFAEQEPGLWDYSLLSGAGRENMKRYVDIALADRKKGFSYPWIVIDEAVGKMAGSTRFYDIQETHMTTQLGYTWYGKSFQGTGLNKHCKFLLLQFAFEKLGFERVEFRADATNARSIAAMVRIGCTIEGILRSNCKSKDGRRNSIILSILKSEWESEVKDRLQSLLQ